MNNIKWISIGVVGSLFAVSHLGMIGYIASRKTESQLPKIDIPVGDYTSYAISATKDGYKLSYQANDPKTAFITKDIKEKGGFLGLANETTQITEEYLERLKSTMPPKLCNVAMACSGSEANDLALRVAKRVTGGSGFIVTQTAYHGNTQAVTEISPSALKQGIPPDNVYLIKAPGKDAYGEILAREWQKQ